MARAISWRKNCGFLWPLPLASRFGHNLDTQFFGSADDRQFRANPHLSLGEQPMQRVDPGHWLTLEFHDHVAASQIRLLGRTTRLHCAHKHTAVDRQLVVANQTALQWDILTLHTDIAAVDHAVPDELGAYEFGRVDGRCKTDALSRQYHGG